MMYCLATTHSENPNRQNFRFWNSHGQHGHVGPNHAIPDGEISRFGSVGTIRRTIVDIQ